MSGSSPDPSPPIVTAIPRDDIEMRNAYRKASDTITDFISHLAFGDGRWCSAKLCFKNPDLSDKDGQNQLIYWWLDFATHDPQDGMFSAEFTELPSCLERDHHVGQRLWFADEDIFDWRVNVNGRLYGGFTIRVARQRLPDLELDDFDRYIGVSDYSNHTQP